MQRKFQRKTEDFTCEHCGKHTTGNGYTNHCCFCLYSKHVDINPGDRAHECQGLMQPIRIEQRKGEYIIIHKCLKCGFERINRTDPADDFEEILRIAAQTR